MTLAQSHWIHGNSLQIEYPERVEEVWRCGFYARVKGEPGSENWLHLAVPTPAVMDTDPMRINTVMVRFRTGSPDVYVRAVVVYDGEKRIASHEDIRLAPTHWTTERLDVPGDPRVSCGICVSLCVDFGVRAADHNIEVSGAGAEFLP